MIDVCHGCGVQIGLEEAVDCQRAIGTNKTAEQTFVVLGVKKGKKKRREEMSL